MYIKCLIDSNDSAKRLEHSHSLSRGELVPLVKPVEDELVSLRRFELWSHMAGAVHSAESEIACVGLEGPGNLSGVQVGLPVDGCVPVEGLDPVLCSNGWHCTIDVSRVVEHSDLTLELLVDPLRSLRLDYVVDLFRAEVPGLDIVGNVEGLSDNIQVKVVEETGAIGAGWEFSELAILYWSLEPWSVVVMGESVLFLN